jgi:hypothetical protein
VRENDKVADPRVEALAGMVGRVEGAACWLARLATRAAVVGGVAGALLWWASAGDNVDDWWDGTVSSLLVLGLCLAPAAWLVNVRFALLELVELPEKLNGVATRRAAHLRRKPPVDRPDGGVLGAARSVWEIVRDYGDVVGSWGTVAQLVAPPFWFLTAVAFAAVPILVVVAAIAGLTAS